MVLQRFGPTPRCQRQRCWVGGLLLKQLLVIKGFVLAKSQASPGGAGLFGKAIKKALPGLFGHRCLALGGGGECCPFEDHSSDRIVSPTLAIEELIRFISGHHQ